MDVAPNGFEAAHVNFLVRQFELKQSKLLQSLYQLTLSSYGVLT